MNKEIKQKWVEALRSGKYTQTDGVLACDQGMCCLGVLLDITGQLEEESSMSYLEYYSTHKDDYVRKTNLRAQKISGWDDYSLPGIGWLEDVTGIFPDTTFALAKMNDEGKSFEEIATYIEENL